MTFNYEHALMHHKCFNTVLTVLKIVSSSFVYNLLSNTALDLIDVVKPAGILNLMVRTGQQKSEQVPLFTTLRPNLDTINKIRSGILR